MSQVGGVICWPRSSTLDPLRSSFVQEGLVQGRLAHASKISTLPAKVGRRSDWFGGLFMHNERT
jgi:hypothetical protein